MSFPEFLAGSHKSGEELQNITLSTYLEPHQMIKVTTDVGTVYAPLNEEFGLTVGSEFGTPFDVGSINQGMAALAAFNNVGQKSRLMMERRFINPERSEISFSMEFYAVSDALLEVVVPVYRLTRAAVGSHFGGADVKQIVGEWASSVGVKMPGSPTKEGEEEGTTMQFLDEVLNKLQVIRGPAHVDVEFGNILTFRECNLTSVAVQFSPSVDTMGRPVYAKCDLTIDTALPITKGNVDAIFFSKPQITKSPHFMVDKV